MSARQYHILMPYQTRLLDGTPAGEGVLDEVWECGPGYTRAELYRDVISQVRDRHPDRITTPISFNVGRNDL